MPFNDLGAQIQTYAETRNMLRLINYALNPALSKKEFVKLLTADLPPAPAYFPMNVKLNSQGYDQLDSIIERSLRALSPEAFTDVSASNNCIILDSRDPETFAKSHITGAINIGLNGSFAPWVGALVNHDIPMLVVADIDKECETLNRLARIGYEKVIGFLKGSMISWEEQGFPVAKVASINAADFSTLFKEPDLLLDVRNTSEYQQGHLPGAINFPLNHFSQEQELPDNQKTYYVYCAGGYRSMIYISLMQSKNLINLVNINGGFAKLKECIR